MDESKERVIQKSALERPILVIFVLFIVALFFRWIDGFVLRLDELVGELILTKSLGFVMVLCFLWLTRRKVKDIGLHSSFLRQSLLIGITTTIAGFIVGYGVEMFIATQQGKQPSLIFGAIDSKMGVTGGMLFALWLLFGNMVNSLMEEGFFRGVVGRLARLRYKFWGANWFQAFVFSLWHLPWVVKYYQIGQIETPGEIASSIFMHSFPQLFIGIVYGYLYLKTNSLWVPWIAHVISNSVSNFVHVSTADGLDLLMPLRMTIYLVVMLLSLFWVKKIAEKYQMPEVKPWE
jgi:membrane protease YdiL (CAAX protease family)